MACYQLVIHCCVETYAGEPRQSPTAKIVHVTDQTRESLEEAVDHIAYAGNEYLSRLTISEPAKAALRTIGERFKGELINYTGAGMRGGQPPHLLVMSTLLLPTSEDVPRLV